MGGHSGGGGRAGRGGSSLGQPRWGDTKLTAALRSEYETNPNVHVTVEQLPGKVTRLTHAMGTASITDHGIRVTGHNGKAYSYGENNMVKGLQHFESLAGPKSLFK